MKVSDFKSSPLDDLNKGDLIRVTCLNTRRVRVGKFQGYFKTVHGFWLVSMFNTSEFCEESFSLSNYSLHRVKELIDE